LYLATVDPEQIKQWWTQWPLALIGVPGGRRTGMWFLDVDSKEGHDEDGLGNWWDLEAQHSSAQTRAHLTGTNGLHFIYQWNADRPIKGGKGVLPPGMEVQGEGKYVIFPPSPYQWKGQSVCYDISDDCFPEPAPEWLYDQILGTHRSKGNGSAGGYSWPPGYGQQKLDEYCEIIRSAEKHHWDEASVKLHKFAQWVGGGAYDVNTAREKILNAAKLNPSAPSDYVGKVERSFDKGVLDPKGPPSNAKVLPESQWFGNKPMELPPALIKGIFPQTGVATIGGQSGGGKSFHAIHFSLCVIPECDQNFNIDHYRIKRKGGVIYFVLEGKASFPMRLTAAYNHMMDKQIEFGERWKIPFAWNTYSPSLFSEGPDGLLKIIDRDAGRMRKEFGVDVVAFVLDTMGLAAIYKKEDDAAQVQKVISDLGRMSEETGALAVNVDHYGKDHGAGLRGSSAKRAGADAVLACLVDRDRDDRPYNHRMVFEKIRDGEEGRVVPYGLRQVQMGLNEDLEPETTCVIQWEVGRPMGKRGKKMPPRKTKTSVPLKMAIEEVGLPVEMEVLREAFYKAHGGSNKAANTAWHRAIEASDLVLQNGKLSREEEG
jgi:hypothetical protein